MSTPTLELDVDIPAVYLPLYDSKYRYVAYPGGRGAGRSWNVAINLLSRSLECKRRIQCAREYQSNIRESVHELLSILVGRLKLDKYFHITDREIRNVLGSQFIFKGMHANVSEVKSMEDIDDVWCEEAHNLAEESLRVLRPTLRKPGSRLIFTWNTHEEDDPVYKLLVKNEKNDPLIRDEGFVKHVTWK